MIIEPQLRPQTKQRGTSLLDTIRFHVENKIASAQLHISPYPHLVIADFFPDEVFEKILAFNPFKVTKGEEWLAKQASAHVSSNTPYHARKQINFHANASFEAPAEQQAFWNELSSCFLRDTWFSDVVRRKYPDYFQLRFGDIVRDDDFLSLFRTELFLQRHEPGYYIGPHTDIATRVFTCIFSFADRDGFEEFGTQLVKPIDRLERCWGSDHYKPDRFEVVKLAPYSPNSFLLFFKTRQSFHSVKAIDATLPNQRYGIQFQFYEPSGGLFKDLSVPDLMHVRHRPSPESIITRGLRKIRGAA